MRYPVRMGVSLTARGFEWARNGGLLLVLLTWACNDEAPLATGSSPSGNDACVDTATADGFYCCCGKSMCSRSPCSSGVGGSAPRQTADAARAAGGSWSIPPDWCDAATPPPLADAATPPFDCVAPCVWELMKSCSSPCERVVTEGGCGVLIDCETYVHYYVGDHLCFTKHFIAAGAAGPTSWRWTDATGSVVAIGFQYYAGPDGRAKPTRVQCTDSKVWYEVDPGQSHCTL